MSHGAEVPLEQSSSKDQAFHLILSSPSFQIHDNEFPEAALHHPLIIHNIHAQTLRHKHNN